MKDYCPNGFQNDWEINRSLDFVNRHGALLLLGVAFLRRCWPSLDRDEERDAVDLIEAYARRQAPAESAIGAMARAEDTVGSGFWLSSRRCDCADCFTWHGAGEQSATLGEHLRHPRGFAIMAARRARRVAGYATQEIDAHRSLYNDIIGPAFWVPEGMGDARHDTHVRGLVAGLDSVREIDDLGMLALGDALEEAGCTNEEMMEHCRGGGPHVRGCWVIEELSGRSAMRLPLHDEPAKPRRPAPLIPMKRHTIKPPVRV